MAIPKKARGPLRVDYVPIGKVRPSPKNARTHTPKQVQDIARSIETVGWTKPIIVDEHFEVLAGHGALQAALQLGMTEVPTIMRSGLTAAQRRAYRLADNKLAEASSWDKGLLAGELGDLQRMGFDMGLTGFDPSEIEFALAPPAAALEEPPEAELKAKPVSKLGDLWCLGRHRIACADSTKPEAYTHLLLGARPVQCVWTDPVYGVSYEKSEKFEPLKNDDLRRGQLKAMLQGAFAHALKHAAPDAGWYIWHASSTREDFGAALRDVGLVELSLIVWAKPSATMGWSDYRQAHEPCIYAALQGVKPAFYADRTETTVWEIQHAAASKEATSLGNGLLVASEGAGELYLLAKAPKGKKVRHVHLGADKSVYVQSGDQVDDLWQISRDTGHGKDKALHPTQKPVELARRALRNSTREGDGVLDMFVGAATTIIAAEQLKRVGYGIDNDPQWVDAGVRRWQELTGKDATHAETQKTFAATAKARKA